MANIYHILVRNRIAINVVISITSKRVYDYTVVYVVRMKKGRTKTGILTSLLSAI